MPLGHRFGFGFNAFQHAITPIVALQQIGGGDLCDRRLMAWLPCLHLGLKGGTVIRGSDQSRSLPMLLMIAFVISGRRVSSAALAPARKRVTNVSGSNGMPIGFSAKAGDCI